MSENNIHADVNNDKSYAPITLDPVKLVDSYLTQSSWRSKENSNVSYNVGGYNLFASGTISSAYWLDKVYPPEIRNAHKDAFMHIHDLSQLMGYCAGWSLADLIKEGLGGVRDKIDAAPASHLSVLVNQMVNFVGIMSNEWAGAQAFSSVDTYLAAFVKAENLSRKEVKQCLQSLLYGLNFPNRWGSQPPFSNITLDLNVPEDLAKKHPYVGGVAQEFTFADCQEEITIIDEELFKLLIEGDTKGNAFQYPIVTINITKDFKWDCEVTKLLFQMTAKTGNPYFANYVYGDLKPSDTRSMCCRLRLDLSELRRSSSGGVGGAADKTGSLGVVTLNLPRFAYLSKHDESTFYRYLDMYMDIAKDSLEIKRKYLDTLMDAGFYPYSKRYLGHFNNHFSTIGLVGMNEMCENFFEDHSDISTEKGKKFAEDVLDYMRERISQYQVETKHLYNLEATPAESTAYRLAKHDVARYPDIITAGKLPKDVYYTNSCHLPVDFTSDPWTAIRNQEDLQTKFSGGTVWHCYLGESVDDWTKVRDFVKNVMCNSKLPYITISPTYSICPIHGFIKGNHSVCPKCKDEQKAKYSEALKEVEEKIKEIQGECGC